MKSTWQRAFYIGLLGLVATFVVCRAGFTVLDVTPRAYAIGVISGTVTIREKVEQELLESNFVSSAGTLIVPANTWLEQNVVDFGWITSGGAIVVYSKKYEVVIVQEPIKNGENIVWKYIIYPDSIAVRKR
jgi:hypothetical protein